MCVSVHHVCIPTLISLARELARAYDAADMQDRDPRDSGSRKRTQLARPDRMARFGHTIGGACSHPKLPLDFFKDQPVDSSGLSLESDHVLWAKSKAGNLKSFTIIYHQSATVFNGGHPFLWALRQPDPGCPWLTPEPHWSSTKSPQLGAPQRLHSKVIRWSHQMPRKFLSPSWKSWLSRNLLGPILIFSTRLHHSPTRMEL